MKGVVLGGGRGTRLRPLTNNTVKHLFPIANRPMIQYGIETLAETGVTDICVVLGHKGREEMRQFLGDGEEFGVDITYVRQDQPLGVAHAVSTAESFVGDSDFLLLLGDNLVDRSLTPLVDAFRRRDCRATIATKTVENPERFGVADVTDDGVVSEVVEKPSEPPSDRAIIGAYAFSPEIFDAISAIEPSWRGELEITDAIQRLVDEGDAVTAEQVDGWWVDAGTPDDLLEANRYLLDEYADETDHDGPGEVDGLVEIHESARIEDDVVVEGPVRIGSDVTLADGTRVGPYASIGPGATLRQVTVKNSIVTEGVELTGSIKLVDSVIGRNTTIGDYSRTDREGRRLIVGDCSQCSL